MHIRLYLYFLVSLIYSVTLFAQDATLKINIRGVSESKITLLPSNKSSLKSIAEVPRLMNGESTTMLVSKEYIPAEFLLRFIYKDETTNAGKVCEKRIFITSKNLELWVNPIYCNVTDSVHFEKGELENTTFITFTKESEQQKKAVGLLHAFLMNYEDATSAFYQQGIKEYEKKRKDYNLWIKAQINKHADLFVSRIFQFHYAPDVEFIGTPTDRLKSALYHYFEGINFNDSLVLNVPSLQEWMNSYISSYRSLAINNNHHDSLLILAGKIAIEKTKKGHPKVYGWMVDYFYKGFESFNLVAGIKMLEPYINDPNCLNGKRRAIEKRLKGLKTLTVGTLTPDFTLKGDAGNTIPFHNFKITKLYKLVLFWSADCGHCKDLVKDLYPWSQQLAIKEKLEIFALSLDDSSTEIPIWRNAKINLPSWIHHRCEGGINSKEANAYFVLSTPVMILIDGKTNKILAMPENIEQLVGVIKD